VQLSTSLLPSFAPLGAPRDGAADSEHFFSGSFSLTLCQYRLLVVRLLLWSGTGFEARPPSMASLPGPMHSIIGVPRAALVQVRGPVDVERGGCSPPRGGAAPIYLTDSHLVRRAPSV